MKVYRWETRPNGDVVAVVRPDALFDLGEFREERIARHEGALTAFHKVAGEFDTYAWVFYDNPNLEDLKRELEAQDDMYAEMDAEDLAR